MFINTMWFNMSVYPVSHYPSISYSDVSVTPLTLPFNISVKWHDINTDLLSIVHFPVCLANVISIVCCHVFVSYVTHMGSILSVLIVHSGCMCGLYVFIFSNCFGISSNGYVTMCLSN